MVYLCPLPLEAEIQAMHLRFAMKAAFTDHATTILLGREDFFSRFSVTFDEARQTFALEIV